VKLTIAANLGVGSPTHGGRPRLFAGLLAGLPGLLGRLGLVHGAIAAPPAIATIPAAEAPAAEATEATGPLRRAYRRIASRLRAEWLVALVAGALSVAFYAWYASQGQILAYEDSLGHLVIARRVVAGLTPGLGQLGYVWLPLNHMLMLPLIWDDWLFHTGLAGSLPSMAAYVLSCVYLYRFGRLLFDSRAAGWAAALVLMLNPSVLYMQATPMSELDLIAAAILALYYVALWARTLAAADLMKAAIATAAGTLIRYDAWPLALILFVMVVYIAWRRRGRAYAESSALAFGVLGFSGCVAWVLYNWAIFHDPLYFMHGPYSSRNQQLDLQSNQGLPTYHNLGLSLKTYGIVSVDTIWWPLAGLALVGLLLLLVRSRLRAPTLAAYATLVPFAFNWLSLVLGMSVIQTPEIEFDGLRTFFNERYGMMMIPAVAVLLAFLVARKRLLLPLVLGLCAFFAVSSSFFGIPYALEDPLHGAVSAQSLTRQQEADWLAAHYQGGSILISNRPTDAMVFAAGVPDQAFVSESNKPDFYIALAHPETSVTWIVLDSTGAFHDPVYANLSTRQDWRQYFTLRATIGTTQFYERTGSN